MNLVRDLALYIPAIRRLYQERNALLAQRAAPSAVLVDLPAGGGEERESPYCTIRVEMKSLDDFRSFERGQSETRPIQHLFFSDSGENIIVQHALTQGIRTDFHGLIPGSDVHVVGNEMREHLMARGFNSRQRAILDMTLQYLSDRHIADLDARIYGHEALSPMALALRGRFPRYIGTEFGPGDSDREKLFPIRHGDICKSDWQDSVFDLVLSADVLEHVPSIDDALHETARILRPGGRFLATFPFLFLQHDSVRFAELRQGAVVHFAEPIYHGNPMDPERGSLVFEIPGWDIIERATQAGFSNVRMVFWADQERGIVGSNLGSPTRPRGVFIAALDK